MALNTADKQAIIAKFKRDSKDTGSTEIQVALLSERISYLTNHLKENPKDHSSRLGLLKLVSHRKHLLKYLKRTKYDKYTALIKELNIKDR